MGHGSRTHFALPPAGVHVSGAGPKACDDLRVPYREGALVMPSICLLSATRAGQMRRMAAHVAAARREHGCAVTITHVRDHATRSRLNAYTAAMGVTSVHAGATHPTCSSASEDIVARWHACPLSCKRCTALSCTARIWCGSASGNTSRRRSDGTPGAWPLYPQISMRVSYWRAYHRLTAAAKPAIAWAP